MNLLDRIRSRIGLDRAAADRRSRIDTAERLTRAGAPVADIRQAVHGLQTPHAGEEIESAWLALIRGDLESALAVSYGAAQSRPYDVDSRLVHGLVRLARDELEHAEHEFDAVIEEFGAEQEASDGRRAVMLARGFAPLDELPTSEPDWDSAAALLTTLWRLSGTSQARMLALQDGHEAGVAIVKQALDRGLALDAESDDGT
ncbi:MAG: hypothetical protein OXH38_07045, partial [Chloroflexi bacterium]|nr:hypothetical protein [Chloroflexota bacterium]